MRIFNILISLLRFAPHIVVYKTSRNRELLDYEMKRWYVANHLNERQGVRGLLFLLAAYKEYRSLFYFRTGCKCLNSIASGQNNLEFYMLSEKIGKGLVIWHGFSTVINAHSIGEDCEIWQNVTIGKASSAMVDDRPRIGNRVKISANAVTVGNIQIGDDAVIGAGAVAVKDVPNGGIVVSQPSRIITR